MTLVGFGYVMVLAAAPAVAERIGASSRNLFFGKQVHVPRAGHDGDGGRLAAVARSGCGGWPLLGFVGALVLTSRRS